MKSLFGGLFLFVAMSSAAWSAVDLNSATQSELEAVKGLGPAKAKAILEYRQKHGPFKSVDDLLGVKGFGKASLAKLKDELTVADASKAAPKASTKK